MGVRSKRCAVDSGLASLVQDAGRGTGWTLLLDGTPQSHVDLQDPTYLLFEYVRRIGHMVDLAAPAGLALDVVHLGGGALTLARYVAVTRPRSRQRVVELDSELTALVRRELPLERRWRVRVSAADARTVLGRLPAGSADLVISDVFAGGRVPAHLTSVEYVREACRVLRPGGVYAANLADGPPLTFARGQAATVRSVWTHTCLIADPGVLRGRGFGNVVLLASLRPLPVPELARRAAGDPAPARVVASAELDRFAGQAHVVTDASAVPSPAPPPGVFD